MGNEEKPEQLDNLGNPSSDISYYSGEESGPETLLAKEDAYIGSSHEPIKDEGKSDKNPYTEGSEQNQKEPLNNDPDSPLQRDSKDETAKTEGDIEGQTSSSDEGKDDKETERSTNTTKVTTGEIHAQVANVIGRVDVKLKDEEKAKLHSVSPVIIEKMAEVFVEPPNYTPLLTKLNTQLPDLRPRVFLITGPQRCGKLTCAFHLAITLLNLSLKEYTEQIKLYQRTEQETRTLIDFVQLKEVAHESVYIVQDAFDKGVLLEELEGAYHKVLSDELKNKNSFLIITSAEQERLAVFSRTIIGDFDSVSLQEVLLKHLERYKSGNEETNLHPDVAETVLMLKPQDVEGGDLVGRFKYPPEIDRFCRLICDLPSSATSNEIIKVAEHVQQTTHRTARGWFGKLHLNEQLYAMLAVLFQGVSRNLLDQLYTDAVKHLNDDGLVGITDPRILGLDDMLDHIMAEETEEGVVRFQTKAFEEEVKKQIKNYHHLLWSLISFILNLVEEYSGIEYWVFRRDLGTAIGRLGIYRKSDLIKVLISLAQQSHGGVVAVAGSALGEVCCQDATEHEFVIEILEAWRESGDFRFMRAFGISVWRIFESLYRARYFGKENNLFLQNREKTLENLIDQLRLFAGKIDDFNDETRLRALIYALEIDDEDPKVSLRQLVSPETALRMEDQLTYWTSLNLESILHAVRQMYQSSPEQIAELVKKWLLDVKNNRAQLAGRLATKSLFLMHEHPSQIIISRHKPLLTLLSPAFSSPPIENDELVLTIAIALENWLTLDPDKTLFEKAVFTELIDIANRAEEQQVSCINILINHWFGSKSEKIRKLAHMLNNRIRIMAGYPVERAGQGFGIILLDSTYKANLGNQAALRSREIIDKLKPQIDLFVMRMGENKILGQPNESISTSILHTKQILPRLIYPLLDSFPQDLSYAKFILVLTWGSVLDIEDVRPEWKEKIVLARAVIEEKINADESIKGQVETFNSVDFVSSQSTQVVTDFLQKYIAPSLKKAGQKDDHEESIDETLLESLTTDQIKSEEEDPARQIMHSLQQQILFDVSVAITTLETWLNSDEEHIQYQMGKAGLYLFLRLLGTEENSPPIETWEKLSTLIPKIIFDNLPWDSGRVILSAFQNWIQTDSRWMNLIFSRSEGKEPAIYILVDKLAINHREALLQYLSFLEEDNPSQAVLNFSERIRLQIDVGQKRLLPQLGEGKQFIGIFYDASIQSEDYRNHLARIVSKIVPKLNEKYGEKLFPLIFRLGCRQLVAEGNQKIGVDQLTTQEMLFAPLVGPILEFINPVSICCVLILKSSEIIDFLDWQDTVWANKFLVYDNNPLSPKNQTPYSIIKNEFGSDELLVGAIINRISEKVGA